MEASKVVVVRCPGALSPDGKVDAAALGRMHERGLRLLTGQSSAPAGLTAIFSPADRVGIKINGIAGRRLSTGPEVALPFARLLVRAGLAEKSITIWERSNRELKDAGYRLNNSGTEFRVFGTDTAGAGYKKDPLEHRGIGSRFSAIQAELVTASVSFAVLKDHGLAGITAGMKNYFGAIHNPNKYHDDHCDPFIADLFDAPPIKTKHRLTILDALTVQFHKGPSYHAKWAERLETLVFGLDPAATDFVGWQIVERLRRAKGLPSLEEDERAPGYLQTAARLGLGRATAAGVQIIEESV